MSNNNHLNLGSIINKIRIIAETKYAGQLDSNLANIFVTDLTIEERRALLFFIMTLYVIFESHISHEADTVERIELAMSATRRAIESSADRVIEENKTLQQYNAEKLIDLKTYIVKTIVFTVCLTIPVVISVAVIFDKLSVLTDLFGGWMEVLKMMFG